MTLPVIQDVLCQSGKQSCAACCGLFNFSNRSPVAIRERLERRTRMVAEAGWDAEKLAQVAKELAALEAPDILFTAVRTCPLAGYLDEEHSRVGCMIHPLRHPTGEDLRDLGAYRDRNICSGHLCAPHGWLGEADRAFLACAPSWRAYSMAVGETGFVKGVLRCVAGMRGGEVMAREFASPSVRDAAEGVLALMDVWEFMDPDPRRFGGFSFAGDDAYERTAASTAQHAFITPPEAAILDALGTLAPDETTARRAQLALRLRLQTLVDALEQS